VHTCRNAGQAGSKWLLLDYSARKHPGEEAIKMMKQKYKRAYYLLAMHFLVTTAKLCNECDLSPKTMSTDLLTAKSLFYTQKIDSPASRELA
jgi:hypothetical protein